MPFRDRLARLRDIASIALAFAVVLGTTLFARAQDVTRVEVAADLARSGDLTGELCHATDDADPGRSPAGLRASARVAA